MTARPTLHLAGICLDCADVEVMARFYAEVFGWTERWRDTPADRKGGEGWIAMSGPDGGPTVSFQSEAWYEPPEWPEAGAARSKMMHLEVGVDGDMDAAVALVVGAGGREAPAQPTDRDPQQLRVMLDPAGHPFCLCIDE